MIKSLILSFQFLTRLPINIEVDFKDDNLAKATIFFPLVGVSLGLLSYLSYRIFLGLSQNLASAMTVVCLIAYTGGLHLDGLSDTFDGFFSNKPREKVLEIMRDSRIGAFGVIALIVQILLKYVLIASLPASKMLVCLVLTLANSRTCQVYEMCYKENARSEGIGYMFNSSGGKKYASLGILIYCLALLIYNYRLMLVLIFNFIGVELIYNYSYKKIGGHTGDVLGAMAEMGEIFSLMTLLAVVEWI